MLITCSNACNVQIRKHITHSVTPAEYTCNMPCIISPRVHFWCIWHVGTTQDLEDTVYLPRVKCGRCSLLSDLVTNRRLRLFGHIAGSSSREDHHRALAAAIRQVPPDWKWPIGRPSHTWLCAIEADLGLWTLALWLSGERLLLEMTGDILWTQQRSSGVRSERKKEEHFRVSIECCRYGQNWTRHSSVYFWKNEWNSECDVSE